MYKNSSIEDGWKDFANFFFVVFVIVWRRFLRKNIYKKSTE